MSEVRRAAMELSPPERNARSTAAVNSWFICSSHQVGLAAVFLDQLMDVIAALAGAPGAFDVEHVELAFDVAEDEIGSGHRAMLSIRATPRSVDTSARATYAGMSLLRTLPAGLLRRVSRRSPNVALRRAMVACTTAFG